MPELDVILCGYQYSGCQVLRHMVDRKDIGKLFVFTHAMRYGIDDLGKVAAELGVAFSTEAISSDNLPFKPDIISSVYYRNIIPQDIIDSCDGRIFNMHPSLLPRHRGCSSVPWAIIEGDKLTGVTFHYIDKGIDTGRILLQTTIPITDTTTQSTLYRLCMDRGIEFWPAAFELVKAGFAGGEQLGETNYHPRGCPLDGEIDMSWPAAKIERFIRAMHFPPLPHARFRGYEITTYAEFSMLIGGNTG